MEAVGSAVRRGVEAFSLDGKRAVVTGGNRGLGLAFARALGECGASVALIARDGDRNETARAELARDGIDVHAVRADLLDDHQLDDAMAAAVAALGGIDVLVNNAGLAIHRASWDVTDEEWGRVFDLNVRALWKCSLAAGRLMRAAGGGSIVNVGSISAMIVNRPQAQASYNASKAAVHQLTKSLAAEWAPHNIRVNALAPGYVKTDMAPVDRPEFRRMWIDDAPQRRYATPEEIAPAVVFLAGDAAPFMTGAVLVIDGGYTLH